MPASSYCRSAPLPSTTSSTSRPSGLKAALALHDVVAQVVREPGVVLVQRPVAVDDIEHRDLGAERGEGHADAPDVVGQEVRAKGVELVQRPVAVDDIGHLEAVHVEGHAALRTLLRRNCLDPATNWYSAPLP